MAKIKHGLSATPTHRIWAGMRSRCYNANVKDYPFYGGRGIRCCERWNDFSKFLEDMGERPENMTLERNDTNGDYAPENCRWASRKEQSSNTRRNIWLTHGGKTLTIQQWSEELNIPRTTLQRRWRSKRPVEEILSKGNFKSMEPARAAMLKAKRDKTHCKHGHEFTPENTYWVQGRRKCKECNRTRAREFYRAKGRKDRH